MFKSWTMTMGQLRLVFYIYNFEKGAGRLYVQYNFQLWLSSVSSMLVKYPSYMKTSDMQSPKHSKSWLWWPSMAICSYFLF